MSALTIHVNAVANLIRQGFITETNIFAGTASLAQSATTKADREYWAKFDKALHHELDKEAKKGVDNLPV